MIIIYEGSLNIVYYKKSFGKIPNEMKIYLICGRFCGFFSLHRSKNNMYIIDEKKTLSISQIYNVFPFFFKFKVF